MEGGHEENIDLGVIDGKEGSGGGGAGRGFVRLFVGASEYGQPSSDRNS